MIFFDCTNFMELTLVHYAGTVASLNTKAKRYPDITDAQSRVVSRVVTQRETDNKSIEPTRELRTVFRPPPRLETVMNDSEWKTYRTRFLVRAKQLTEPLDFVDVLGREHHGQKGDYVVEFSPGILRIAPQELFEDIYVALARPENTWPLACKREWPVIEPRRAHSRRALVT